MNTSTATTPITLQIILGSTREGRASERFGEWAHEVAAADERFGSVELVDLREYELPFLNEAVPPSNGGLSEEAKVFARKIAEADAYLIIAPEYNHGIPGVLKNALDSIYQEWNEKAVGFLSYGAGAGGARSVEHLKQVTSWLRLAPVPNALHVVHYYKQDLAEVKEAQGKELDSVLDDLARWGEAMRSLRQTNPRA
jgi:NAD(P)H-dependent FMN reductase